MEKPKISVIVPVYNAEKYLHRCIDSILAQTFSDIEILLINDGSKDNSGKICDEYALKDNRIRVFHKENGGVSSARNVGLKNMIGEYSIHVDSDDWIEPNMYEEMYAKAIEENADMVICDYKIIKGTTVSVISQKPQNLNPEAIISQLLEAKMHGSVCNKLIKCSIIKSKDIKFKTNVTYCEDLLFNTEVLLLSESISHVSKSFYHYMMHEQSLTSYPKLKPTLGFFCFLEYLKNSIIKSGIPIKYYYFQVIYVKSILFNSGFITMGTIKNFEAESNKYLRELKHHNLYTKLSLNLIFVRLYFFASMLRFMKNIYINIFRR